VPDIVTLGKALGGGIIPISAVAYDRSIFNFRDKEILKPGWYGATWANAPPGVAAAIVFLDILQEEKMIERVIAMGEFLTQILNKHTGQREDGGYCRRTGMGLMQGLEFKKTDGTPDPAKRDTVLKRLFEAKPTGIFTLATGLDGINPTIRFAPPFIITREEVAYLDNALTKALSKL
jgi:ornithine--oxo-acid transaminase